jgi:hypothetical protein
MRIALIFAVCTTITSQAAIWQFDLGPTIGVFGLNGANERPTPTASPATGAEIKDHDSNHFINYDTETQRLELHFGWGSDASLDYGGPTGTDLTANLSGIHIHGPAFANESTGVLYNLLSLAAASPPTGEGYFNPSGNGRSGAIDLTVQLVEGVGGFSVQEQQQQLRNGQWYINIHSEGQYAAGEIRGQLLYVIPEPEHYAAFAGIALLGFAGFRRYKMANAGA